MTITKPTNKIDACAYWLAVLGNRSPSEVVEEFRIKPGVRLISEWLGCAEDDAARAGCTSEAEVRVTLRDWRQFHGVAVLDLDTAASEISAEDAVASECGDE